MGSHLVKNGINLRMKHLPHWVKNQCAGVIGLSVALIAVFSYRNTLQVFFVQDDFWFLRAAQESWPNKFLLGGVLPDYWRPISTYWFHWINVTLLGTNAFWHHFFLLGIFGLTVFLWGLALYEITGSYFAEIAGASVYGVSRLHLYTLGWISGAIDILAALFLVVTLFLIWRSQNKRVPVWMIVLFIGLGLLSKEPVILVIPLSILTIFLNAKLANRRLSDWDKRLIIWSLGVGGVYLLGWLFHTNGHRTGGEMGFYWQRGYTLLGNAISAIVPKLDFQESLPWIWFLLPISLVVMILSLEKKSGVYGAIWGLGLYGLPVLPFILFTQPLLQPYYAHFSMLGLSLLIALAFASIWNKVHLPNSRLVFASIGAMCILGYLVFSIRKVETGVLLHQSPALLEATYSKAAYEQIMRYCIPEDGCKSIIFLDVTDLMWWSTGKGVMVPVMFPGVQADFDGYDDHESLVDFFPKEESLVLQQVSETEFKIVNGD